MLLLGVNLTKISQSTPHLPLILVGMLVTSCSPTLAALLVAGLCPGAGGLRSVFRGVREWRVGLIWYAIALVGPVLLMLAARAINAVRLGVLPTHLPSFSAPEAADALWGSCGWCCNRASLEHLAPVVPDIAGRLFDCDPDRRGGNLPTPDLDSIDLRLDVQQYQRQSPHCDDCAPGAQPGCESNTHTCGRRRATSHHRTSLSCCSHDRRLYNKHSNASRSQRPCIMSNSSAIG